MDKEVITSPIHAIRKYCLECCMESPGEVKLCPAEGCVLHPFRFGKNPFLANRKSRAWTEEQKEAQRQRMALINEKKKKT